MAVSQPRLPASELADPKKASKLLEAAFDEFYADSTQTNITVAEQGDAIYNIQQDITNITNIIEGGTAPTKVIEGIDLRASAGTTTDIYTLAKDFGFVAAVWLVGNTVSGSGTNPVVSLRINAGEDVAAGQTIYGFTQTPTSQQVFRFPQVGSSMRMAAGDTLSLEVETAATHTAFTVDLYLYLWMT